MIHSISSAITRLRSLMSDLQVKRLLAIALVAVLWLPLTVATQQKNEAVTKKIDRIAHQTDSQRPKTSGEWQKEAAHNVPLQQRAKDITEDSAEALQDFGTLYPDTAKRSTSLREKSDAVRR